MQTGSERTIAKPWDGAFRRAEGSSRLRAIRARCPVTGIVQKRLALCLAVTVWAWALSSVAAAQSWIFQPSYYSHTPQGERVAQFQPEASISPPTAPNYIVSGYRHTRSTIRGAESYDHLHVVRTWGLGEFLRPYEEWEFPFRPGATPYGPWGNPQGPWTLPFDSWRNPFGLGRLPGLPWWLWPRW